MLLKKFYRFSYLTGMMLIIVSMLLSLNSTDPALAAGNPGSLWTTTVACGTDPVDANHFAIGDNIYLHMRGFEPNSTQRWSITGKEGNASCDPDIEVAGGEVTFDADGDGCFLAYTVQPDDCGTYQVKVGTKGDNYRVDEAAPPVELGLAVSKTPDPSSVPYTGGDVIFSILITNTGNRDLTITGVKDSVFTSLGSCPALIGTILAVGQSTTCSFTGSVTGAPGTNHNNTFTVDAEWETQPVSNSGSAVVAIDPLPALTGSLQKSAAPISIEPGGSVTFTVEVTNDSEYAITLNSLTDSVFGNITSVHDLITSTNCVVGGEINPGTSYTCNFTATVNDLNGGLPHEDTVTAGVSLGSQSTTWSGSATVTFVEGPALSLNVTKVPSETTLVYPGGWVRFDFWIQNTSNREVNFEGLEDDVFGNLDGNALGTCVLPDTLAIAGTYACYMMAEITGDPDTVHENTVTASISFGDLTAEASATAQIPITPRPLPTIEVVKTADPTVMDEPGGPVNYTIEITNTSSTITAKIDDISDNMFGDLIDGVDEDGNCPGLKGPDLAPLESISCTFTRDITGSGSFEHTNTVTVNVYDPVVVENRASAQDDATVTVNRLPEISVIKSANPSSVSELGGEVTFTVTVTNEVSEELTLTDLVDSVFGDLDLYPGCSVPQTLPVGGNYSCSFSEILLGEVSTFHQNVVTATAEDSDRNHAEASDDAVVTFQDALPTISVVKTANPGTVNETGEDVTYTVRVKNTSGEPVTLESLTDDKFTSLGCTLGGVINPQETYSCEFTRLVSGEVGTPHINQITAVARDNEGNPAEASNTATVTFQDVQALIEVAKTPDPIQVTEPGDEVTFTVVVDNLTAEDITLTSLVDDVFNDITTVGHDGITATDCVTPRTIVGLDSYSCSFTASVSGNAGFIHVNTVTATVTDNDGGDPVTDSASAQVDVVDALPELAVTKTANQTSVPAPNGTVSYTVVVTNNSIEPVTLDSLQDDKFGNLFGQGDCQSGVEIQPGQFYTCTFEGEISGQSGDTHTNRVTATVSDNDGNSVQGDDTADVEFTDPPRLVLVDPCTVGCDLPNVTGQICNEDQNVDYNGTIDWDAYVDDTRIGGGLLSGIPAGECVDLSSPRQGNGMYSIVVTFVDENNESVDTECGPLACEEPGPPPPVTPPTGTPGVFIPVTGFDFSRSGLISIFQNLGLSLVSVGLVLHGLSLNGKTKKKSRQ